MKAFLILEDGTVFCGNSIGSTQDAISEVVFNTSMTGYLDILTDSSYAGQTVVMTYPLIGNYGICYEGKEVLKSWPSGLIVGEISRISSNFRSQTSINEFLETNLIPGISGIDTRALTKILREKGTMKGMITTNEAFDMSEVNRKIKEHRCANLVEKTSSKEKCVIPAKGLKVAVYDFGAKDNIVNTLVSKECEVHIYPAHTKASELLEDKPDGIMLSNGPGNPKDCKDIIEQVRILYNSNLPIFAIGLGHQLMALAAGGDTYKMQHGHRGANYPVRDLTTGKVYISSQSHGYAVKEGSLNESTAIPYFLNVNDESNEGYIYNNKNIATVQFHPEVSSEGTIFLFDRFIDTMKTDKKGE